MSRLGRFVGRELVDLVTPESVGDVFTDVVLAPINPILAATGLEDNVQNSIDWVVDKVPVVNKANTVLDWASSPAWEQAAKTGSYADIKAAMDSTGNDFANAVGYLGNAVTAAPEFVYDWAKDIGSSNINLAGALMTGDIKKIGSAFFDLGKSIVGPTIFLASKPIEDVHGYQGEQAYNFAMTNQWGAGAGFGFNLAAEYINANPQEKEAIKQVFENGYDSNKDGEIDFTGGRAVWEYIIGKQNRGTKIFFEIVNDPWNALVVLTFAETALKGVATGMMKGAPRAQAAVLKLAESLGMIEKGASIVTDLPTWAAGQVAKKAIFPAVQRVAPNATAKAVNAITNNPVARLFNETEASKGMRQAANVASALELYTEPDQGLQIAILVNNRPMNRPPAKWNVMEYVRQNRATIQPGDGYRVFGDRNTPSFVVDPDGNVVMEFSFFTGKGKQKAAQQAADALNAYEARIGQRWQSPFPALASKDTWTDPVTGKVYLRNPIAPAPTGSGIVASNGQLPDALDILSRYGKRGPTARTNVTDLASSKGVNVKGNGRYQSVVIDMPSGQTSGYAAIIVAPDGSIVPDLIITNRNKDAVINRSAKAVNDLNNFAAAHGKPWENPIQSLQPATPPKPGSLGPEKEDLQWNPPDPTADEINQSRMWQSIELFKKYFSKRPKDWDPEEYLYSKGTPAPTGKYEIYGDDGITPLFIVGPDGEIVGGLSGFIGKNARRNAQAAIRDLEDFQREYGWKWENPFPSLGDTTDDNPMYGMVKWKEGITDVNESPVGVEQWDPDQTIPVPGPDPNMTDAENRLAGYLEWDASDDSRAAIIRKYRSRTGFAKKFNAQLVLERNSLDAATGEYRVVHNPGTNLAFIVTPDGKAMTEFGMYRGKRGADNAKAAVDVLNKYRIDTGMAWEMPKGSAIMPRWEKLTDTGEYQKVQEWKDYQPTIGPTTGRLVTSPQMANDPDWWEFKPRDDRDPTDTRILTQHRRLYLSMDDADPEKAKLKSYFDDIGYDPDTNMPVPGGKIAGYEKRRRAAEKLHYGSSPGDEGGFDRKIWTGRILFYNHLFYEILPAYGRATGETRFIPDIRSARAKSMTVADIDNIGKYLYKPGEWGDSIGKPGRTMKDRAELIRDLMDVSVFSSQGEASAARRLLGRHGWRDNRNGSFIANQEFKHLPDPALGHTGGRTSAVFNSRSVREREPQVRPTQSMMDWLGTARKFVRSQDNTGEKLEVIPRPELSSLKDIDVITPSTGQADPNIQLSIAEDSSADSSRKKRPSWEAEYEELGYDKQFSPLDRLKYKPSEDEVRTGLVDRQLELENVVDLIPGISEDVKPYVAENITKVIANVERAIGLEPGQLAGAIKFRYDQYGPFKNGEEIKAAGYFLGSTLRPGMITITRYGDVKTILHEFSHAFVNYLNPEDRAIAARIVGASNTDVWSGMEHERFARLFERFVVDPTFARSLDEETVSIFNRMRIWVSEAWDLIVSFTKYLDPDYEPDEISPEAEKFFSRLLQGQRIDEAAPPTSRYEPLPWQGLRNEPDLKTRVRQEKSVYRRNADGQVERLGRFGQYPTRQDLDRWKTPVSEKSNENIFTFNDRRTGTLKPNNTNQRELAREWYADRGIPEEFFDSYEMEPRVPWSFLSDLFEKNGVSNIADLPILPTRKRSYQPELEISNDKLDELAVTDFYDNLSEDEVRFFQLKKKNENNSGRRRKKPVPSVPSITTTATPSPKSYPLGPNGPLTSSQKSQLIAPPPPRSKTIVPRKGSTNYLQTGDMYLDMARQRGDFTDAEYELLVMPMPDVDQTKTKERVIDAYRKALGQGKTEREAITEVTARIVKFSRLDKKAQEATLAGLPMPRVTTVRKTLNRMAAFNRVAREGQMYNITKFATRPLSDAIGNSVHMLVGGQPGAAKKQLTTGKRFFDIVFFKPSKAMEYATKTNNGVLAGLGRNLPVIIRGDYAKNIDKYGLAEHDLTFMKWARDNNMPWAVRTLASVIASERVQAMSHASDLLSRENLALTTIVDEFAKKARRFADELTTDGLDGDAIIREAIDEARIRTGLKDTSTFGPEDITSVLKKRKVSGADQYARAWTDSIEEIFAESIKTNREILFTGSPVRRYEEGIGHIMYYYYWQSRSLNLAARSAMKNPLIMSSYAKMWNGAQNEAERNGYSDTFVGTLSFWGNPENTLGWFGLTNALGLIVPGFMMSEWYDLNKGDEDGPWYEQLSKVIPVTSLFGAAWAALGHSDEVPDLIGTRQVENLALAIIDWGKANDMDLTNGQPTESVIEKIERHLLEGANAAAQGLGIASGEYEPYVPASGKKDVIKSVLWQQAVEDWGVSPEDWTPEQWNEISMAMTVIDEGSGSSERADRAFGDWSKYVLFNQGAKMVMPGGSILRYNPREEARNTKNTDDNARLQRDVVTAAPETRDLLIQQEQVDGTSTDAQKAAADYWSMIVYRIADDTENYPDDMMFPTAIGAVSAKTLRSMSEEERRAVADAYQQVVGTADDRAMYYENRQAAINSGKVPEVKAYEDYKDLIGTFNGDVAAFREWARSTNPYFAKLEEDRRKYEERTEKDPAKVEEKLDRWAYSVRAYQAFRGRKFSMYDADPNTSSAPDTGAAVGLGLGANRPTDAQRLEQETAAASGESNNLVRLALGQQPVTASSNAMKYDEWRRTNKGNADDYLRTINGVKPLPDYFRQ